jgi:hypothetical protein
MERELIVASFDRIQERSGATAASCKVTREKFDMTSEMATRESSGATDAIFSVIVAISHRIAGIADAT